MRKAFSSPLLTLVSIRAPRAGRKVGLPSNLEDQHRQRLVQPGRRSPLAHQVQTIGPPVRHQFLMPAHSLCRVLPECRGSANVRRLKMREAASWLVQPVPRRRRQRWSRFRVTASCRSGLNRRAKWLQNEVSGDLNSAATRAFKRVWPHQ